MSPRVMIASVATCAALLVVVASGYELIELNDANNNQLELDLSRPLRILQAGLAADIKLAEVEDARLMVESCKRVRSYMKGKSDELYNGLAGKINQLLADPTVERVCNIKLSQLDEYDVLDSYSMESSSYLRRSRVAELAKLSASIEAQPDLKLVLEQPLERARSMTLESLLENGAEDTRIMFGQHERTGFLKLEVVYRRECAIDAVRPLCKLARRSPREDVTAMGADLSELSQALQSKPDELARHSEASGVSGDEARAQCSEIEMSLRPMRTIEAYLEAGLLERGQLEAARAANTELDFYYELANLCSRLTATGKQ